MHKSYFIETFGCQMNVADSELVAGLLEKEGFSATEKIEQADAVFVNTCAIREHAEEKVHSQLGRYYKLKQEKPSMIIGVLGCMAQHLQDDILESRPYVDLVLGPDSYRRLPGLIRSRMESSNSKVDTQLSRFEVYDGMFPSRNEGINAWISIMRGCDKFCTFCIVPFTRGRERSRSVDSIVSEARNAAEQGFPEITLLGQNVNSFSNDGDNFAALLEAVARVDGIRRIRYTSPHPQDMTEDVLNVMATYDNICNYVHLPLQAGSNRILKRMNRTYSREHFLKLADTIRNTLPNVGISTDIIVGFPGETDSEFNKTMEVMNAIKFDSAFTFKYSSRPGTKAAEFTDHVPAEVMQDRLEKIMALQKQHTFERNLEQVGKVEQVLVEKPSKRSSEKWAGRTDANKWVIFNCGNAKIKDMVPVEIIEARGISLHGKLLKAKAAA